MCADRNLYSDLYKDVYGFRPGAAGMRAMAEMTDEEFEKEWDYLCNQLEIVIEQEAAITARNIATYEALIEANCKAFNIDRATAIRWDLDNYPNVKYDDHVDYDYYAYHHGLPYNYDVLKGCYRT